MSSGIRQRAAEKYKGPVQFVLMDTTLNRLLGNGSMQRSGAAKEGHSFAGRGAMSWIIGTAAVVWASLGSSMNTWLP